jgi:alpha-glucosidase
MFYGPDITHIVGLGADFRMSAVNINLLGQVVMPGGPYGNRLQLNEQDRTSGIQVPICYTLGQGKKSGAIFVNETRPLIWDFSSIPWTVSLSGPLGPRTGIDFFVLIGEDLPALRRAFMQLVGRPPVPPQRLFAPMVIDWDKPKEIAWADRFKEIAAAIPFFKNFSLMVLGQTDSPPLSEARKAGLDLVIRENPYVNRSSPLFPDMEKRGFLVRESTSQGKPLVLNYQGQPSALVDYTDPAAASYWHSMGRASLMTAGARFFFLTGGEPETYSSLAWYSGIGSKGLHSHYSWGNRFSLKWLEAFWIGLRNQRFSRGEQPRIFLLTRAGLGGMARFAAGLYTIEPNLFFPDGAGQARAHVNLSGVDYYSTDVTPLLKNWPLERYTQLYEAWLSKNAFLNLPLLIPREMLSYPWARQNLKIKAQLEPYYYSLARWSSQTGNPMTSPLLYYFQDDLRARSRAFETMVGPSLLVAAGVNPGEELLTFYLPKGRWFDILGYDLVDQQEGGMISLPCKLDGFHVPPLLLKEGAILPTWDKPEDAKRAIQIKAFPGQEPSSFEWYEDNGTNHNYSTGESLKTLILLNPATQSEKLTLTIKAREGNLPGSPTERPFILEILGVGTVGTITLDGNSYPRVALIPELEEHESAWVSSGKGTLIFKTPSLDLSQDHVLTVF